VRGGFEPPVRFYPYNGLANRRIRPLCHRTRNTTKYYQLWIYKNKGLVKQNDKECHQILNSWQHLATEYGCFPKRRKIGSCSSGHHKIKAGEVQGLS
jgi:hypothetical protein